VQESGDTVRAPPTGEPHLDDSAFPTAVELPGTAVRPAGPIVHRLRAPGTVAVGPFLGRGRRALESLGGTGVGPAVVDDTAGQPQPALRSQTSISVDHEDLPVIDVRVVTTPIPEVLT